MSNSSQLLSLTRAAQFAQNLKNKLCRRNFRNRIIKHFSETHETLQFEILGAPISD